MTKKAVLLLSGGLDSATVFAITKAQGFDVYAMSFVYGQRNGHELAASRQLAATMGAKDHKIAEIDLRLFGGSALTDNKIDIPRHASAEEIGLDIPVTYVPARNTIFLSFALAWAEVLEAYDIFIGVNAVDYSGYPDCRPEFIQSFETMANLATAYGIKASRSIRIHTPLIHLTKAEIIRNGLELGVNYGLTISCYDPDAQGKPCGTCDSCHLRARGFKENSIPDPALVMK